MSKKNAIILYILFLCLPVFLSGQNIKYSFATGDFDHKFPFDENFSVEFEGVPDGTEVIEMKIWNTTKVQKVQKKLARLQQKFAAYERKRLKGNLKGKKLAEYERLSSRIVFSKETLLRHPLISPPVYGMTKLIPQNTSGNTRPRIDFAAKLQPNESYFIEIITSKITKPDAGQKTKITAALLNNPKIKSLIKTLVNSPLAPENLDYFFISNTFKPAFVVETQAALTQLDERLHLVDLPPVEMGELLRSANILLALGEMRVTIENIKTSAAEFNRRIPPANKIDFEPLFARIDYTRLTKGSDHYNEILADFQKAAQSSGNETLFNDNFKPGIIEEFDSFIEHQENLLESLIKNIILAYTEYYSGISQSYLADAVQNSRKYIFADLGYGYADGITHFSQASASIYFRPINESIPPKQYTGLDWLLTKISVGVGITVTGDIQNQERKGIVSNNQAVLLGLGIRIVPGVKINFGGLFYYDIPSPVVSKYNPRVAPFASLAIDFSVTPSFKEAFNKK